MVDLEFLTLVNKDQLKILTGGGTVTSVDGETVSFTNGTVLLTTDDTEERLAELEGSALITPVTAPAEPMIPVIGTNNAQQNVAIGEGLAIEDDKLVATGIAKRLYKHIVSVPVDTPSEGQVSTCIFEALNDNASPLDSTNAFGVVAAVTENSEFIPLNLIAVPSEAGFILVYMIGGRLMYYRLAEYEIEDAVQELGEVSES